MKTRTTRGKIPEDVRAENPGAGEQAGEAVGGIGGTLAGAALGSMAGPIGTIVGGIAGAERLGVPGLAAPTSTH
jgi:hypothetical protein